MNFIDIEIDKLTNSICCCQTGNLFAFVCKLSKEAGFGGVIAFFSKSILAEHYIEKLKAQYVGKLKLGIFEREAESLINKYFN